LFHRSEGKTQIKDISEECAKANNWGSGRRGEIGKVT